MIRPYWLLPVLVPAAVWAGQAEERIIVSVETASAAQSVLSSPDSRHAALVLKLDQGRRRVVLDGTAGPEHDDVGGLCFSPDGSRLAYWAADSGRWCAVVDGVEGTRCGGIRNLCFAPDGQAAWFAIVEGRHVLVVGDGESLDFSTYGGIHEGPLIFSDDGGQHACIMSIRSCLTSRYVVLDRIPGTQPYDDIAGLQFRPGTGSVVYAAKAANRWQVVTDCRIVGDLMKVTADTARYDEVRYLACSRDGSRLGFSSRMGTDWFAVVDGHAFGPMPVPAAVVFSPDSRHWACCADFGDSVLVLLDGSRAGSYDAAGGLCFGPDGSLAYYAKRSGNWFVVHRGKEQGRFEGVTGYADLDCLAFSPDGNRLAFGGQRDGRCFAVVDGIEGPRFDEVGQFAFSPDSRHVAYVAVLGNSSFVVCDSVCGPGFDAVVFKGGELVFDPSGRLRYLASRVNGAGLDIFEVTQNTR